ncbi:MAG: GldG family protein [Undibacterium sp.]|nr:GldG family protein [Opitutaceae bacterium]
MPSPFQSFRAVRWLRTFNLVLQAMLVLTLVGGLNYLARSHPWRFDLTSDRRFSLSPETLSYVKNLPRPVRIVVTFKNEFDNPEVRGLLQEYRLAAEANPNGAIKVDYIDVYQNRREAEPLGLDQPDVILLIAGDKPRALAIDELYRMVRDKDGRTQRSAFLGEQVLTAALLDVSSPERKKIYFLAGHGELRPEDTDANRGLSSIRELLRSRNFDVETLDLTVARSIPDKAALLIAVAPQSPFKPKEQELLRQYLSNSAGRLLLFLSTRTTHGLEDLLLDWGTLVDDDVICDTGAENMTEDGDLIIGAFQPHPITQTLINYGLTLRLGETRTVRPDPGRSIGGGLTTLTLAATSLGAWGERGYRERGVPRYDPGVDIRPIPGMEPRDRLGIVTAAERVAVREGLAFSVRGGRLVVFGSGDLISNARIVNVGNQSVFLNAVNWTVDRDTQLNIPARPIERFQLSLSAADLSKLRYALLFALPGLTAFLGLAVYWTRRH